MGSEALWGRFAALRRGAQASLGRKGLRGDEVTRKMNHSPPCLPFPESTRAGPDTGSDKPKRK